MKIFGCLVALFALLLSTNVHAADSPSAIASKVLSCYKAGNNNPLSIYACAGVWVTPRILSLCFLDTNCPVVPDSIDARGMVAAALGGEDKLDAKISIDLANVLEIPNRLIIKECQPFTDETGFKECVSKQMTQPAVQPILNCAAAATDKDRAVCLAKTAPKEVAGAAAAIECVANNGGGTAALKECAKVQPWDKVEAVSACVAGATAAGAKVDCLLSGTNPKQQEFGRCVAAAQGRSSDAMICMGKLDPAASAKLQELQCAASAGADSAKVVACFAASAKGDEAKLALCAVGDKQKAASCLLDTRPEYKTAAQVLACAQGGRDAGSLVANCSDFLVKDPTTRATLACVAKAGSDTRNLAGCAASAVFPPDVARYVTCAATSQGPTSFALCAAGPLMNEEWRIATECAVQTGGNPVGFAGCTAGRLTLKELTQCLSGGSCFGPNNTIVKAYTDAFNDLMHGPGTNNEIVVAFHKIEELSGGSNSVVNNPGQIFGGDGSVFHNPRQILGGENSVANQLLTKPLGGEHSVPDDIAKGAEHLGQETGKAVSTGARAVGEGAQHLGQETGKTASQGAQAVGEGAQHLGNEIGKGLKKLNPF